jgi:hypothetical protein
VGAEASSGKLVVADVGAGMKEVATVIAIAFAIEIVALAVIYLFFG